MRGGAQAVRLLAGHDALQVQELCEGARCPDVAREVHDVGDPQPVRWKVSIRDFGIRVLYVYAGADNFLAPGTVATLEYLLGPLPI